MRVKSAWRGGGIGSRLLAAAEQLAIARGFAAIDLEVEATNQRARALYDRRGYAVIGSYHGGTRIQMRKRLYADLSDN